MTKKQFSIHEAKTAFSELVRRALAGEEIIIARRKTPLIRLEVIRPATPKLGRFRGKIKMAEDFDAPLEDFDEYSK